MKYTNTNRKQNKGHSKVEFDITVEDLIRVWEKQNGRCALSGIVLTHHVDGSGKKEDLFYWWIRTVHDNMKLKVENNDAFKE